jgi:hypothetical protein
MAFDMGNELLGGVLESTKDRCYDDWPANSRFHVGTVVSLLPVKNKTSFFEYALEDFPVYGGYAWHV